MPPGAANLGAADALAAAARAKPAVRRASSRDFRSGGRCPFLPRGIPRLVVRPRDSARSALGHATSISIHVQGFPLGASRRCAERISVDPFPKVAGSHPAARSGHPATRFGTALVPDASSDTSDESRSGTGGTHGTHWDASDTRVLRLGAERSPVQILSPRFPGSPFELNPWAGRNRVAGDRIREGPPGRR